MRRVEMRRAEVLLKVPLLPSQLGNISEAIYKHLNACIGKYIKKLNSIVICYEEEVGIMSEVGVIDRTAESIFFKVSVEFILLYIPINGVSEGKLERHLENGVELSSYGVLSVVIKGSFTIPHGVYPYRVQEVHGDKLQVKGVFIE
ncbi:hypothetical protein NEFER03_0557 [Nematocida sp. LUAm3]|nr:hypothetical protein NEFER03_0557 [Nematocida sp. LUAm3]KAI5175524.1 hypothetical protein NEFER02_1430 [Nematocida sp. LUAm2]KAI5178446.1 hypothetical protein NEFER01_1593 [Nematocida sp. LUAm1]